jgi:hypothetical protein
VIAVTVSETVEAALELGNGRGWGWKSFEKQARKSLEFCKRRVTGERAQVKSRLRLETGQKPSLL